MDHPRSAYGASPSRGRPQRPGKAGSAAALDGTVPVLLLSSALLLAPAIGSPTEELLQDTLKSAVVAFAALLGALAFFRAESARDAPLRWHAVLWLPLLLCAYALGSMAWSHTYLAGVEAVRWFLFALIAWVALNTFTRERLPLLAGCVHGGAVLASVWAAWQFWGALALFPQGPQPASTFVNRNFFAEYAVCTLPFAALLLANARTLRTTVLLAASTGFVVTALLMTGTRGALIAMWLLLLLVLPLAAWRCRAQLQWPRWPRAQKVAALAVLAGTVALLGAIPSGNRAIVDEGYGSTPLARGLHRAQSIRPSDHSLNIRMVMWRDTLRVIAARPLAGVGAGAWESAIPAFQSEEAQVETDYYVHNEFLQLVAEYGLVGWSFLLLLAAWLLHAAWRTLRDEDAVANEERPGRFVFLASLLALLVVSNIGFPWRLAATGLLFAVCVGGLAASEARLRSASAWFARPLRWSPRLASGAALACGACLVLATYVTVQAVRAESRLVGAARLALGLSASGNPNDPRQAPVRARVLELVREGIAIHPHYRKITPMVGDELARWGDWADAIPVWESVLASRPQVVALLTNVARGYDALGQPAMAQKYLQRARDIQPRAPSVRSLEVLMLARAGDEPLALRRAQEALAEGIVDYDLVNTSYLLALRAKNYPLAQKLLEQRMREWPESRARGLIELGLLYADGLQDPHKALAAFRLGLATASPAERPVLLEQVPAPYRAQLQSPQTSASNR